MKINYHNCYSTTGNTFRYKGGISSAGSWTYSTLCSFLPRSSSQFSFLWLLSRVLWFLIILLQVLLYWDQQRRVCSLYLTWASIKALCGFDGLYWSWKEALWKWVVAFRTIKIYSQWRGDRGSAQLKVLRVRQPGIEVSFGLMEFGTSNVHLTGVRFDDVNTNLV